MPASAPEDRNGTAAPPARGGDRVCAVVVTYRPGPEVPGHLEALVHQADRLIVVDNASSAGSRALLAPLAGRPNVELVCNRENRGTAAALNQGIERALAGDFEWVATFDQDSRAPEGFVAGLLAGFAAFAGRQRVAVVAPLYRDRNLGFVYSPGGPLPDGPAESGAVAVTATSGNLLSVRALRAVGGFRDDFFIDCVDFEFCLRCRRMGWLVLEVRDVVLDHEQGRWQQRRWLWKAPRFNDYDATRRYYQARNRLVLYAHFAAFEPRWVLRDAWGYGCDLIKLLLFGERRWTKVAASLMGAGHALIGRMGPRHP